MKKLLLSAFVVLCFILYIFQQRHEGSSVVIAPKKNSNSSSSQSNQSNPSQSSTSSSPSAAYKNGSYTGDVADAFYGNIQVKAIIQGGKITDVQFLQYPNDRSNSVMINQTAMPYLKQEAVQVQSAHVDLISGATDTSYAFIQSLSAALSKAH